MNIVSHIYLSILAESVAKKAMLAHYTVGGARQYHHTGMVEEIKKLLAEINECGVLEDKIIEGEAA